MGLLYCTSMLLWRHRSYIDDFLMDFVDNFENYYELDWQPNDRMNVFVDFRKPVLDVPMHNGFFQRIVYPRVDEMLNVDWETSNSNPNVR